MQRRLSPSNLPNLAVEEVVVEAKKVARKKILTGGQDYKRFQFFFQEIAESWVGGVDNGSLRETMALSEGNDDASPPEEYSTQQQ